MTLLLSNDLETRIMQENGLSQLIIYPLKPDSYKKDIGFNENSQKFTGLGYLNEHSQNPTPDRTQIQESIEKIVNNGELIIPYIGKDDRTFRRMNRGEVVNRRNSYENQFFEPHAAGGGRIIDLKGHLLEGRLIHFNKPAEGNYIWVIDENYNFIVGNRGGFDNQGQVFGMFHDMYQMPADFGSGKRHIKLDKRKTFLPHSILAKGKGVYGAGEVTISDGYIQGYNADSGHYVKLTTDISGPREPDNFVSQSLAVFNFLSKQFGWNKLKSGAIFNSSYN